jgi:uncharacterized membrane protein
MRKILVLFFLSISVVYGVFSQISEENDQMVSMADQFREDGKIYVVIAVVLTILIGIGYYLWRMDVRLRKLEDDIRDSKSK